MKWNAFIILIIQICSLSAWSAELFVWQPTESQLPVILAKASRQSSKDAAMSYTKAFNLEKSLTLLNDGPLEIDFEGFREFYPLEPEKPRFLVLANDPYFFRGNKNSKTWYRDLADFGAEVYVLPTMADLGMSPKLAGEFRDLLTKNFHAVLALGGNDLDPSIYGDENREAENTNRRRDISEMQVIRAFIDSKQTACFGICRGMQLTAAILGYKLYQDIKTETNNTHDHMYEGHKIKFVGGRKSVFQDIFKDRKSIEVNSTHHQAVNPDSNKTGPLILVATHQNSAKEDPIAEIMEFKSGRGFLVQFHPERMKSHDGRKIMRLMVDMARGSSTFKPSRCANIFN